MKLKTEDLDRAVDFIVRFLSGQRDGELLRMVRTKCTHHLDSIVTPSGKLLGIMEETLEGQMLSSTVQLRFLELPTEPLELLGGQPQEAVSDTPPHVRRH